MDAGGDGPAYAVRTATAADAPALAVLLRELCDGDVREASRVAVDVLSRARRRSRSGHEAWVAVAPADPGSPGRATTGGRVQTRGQDAGQGAGDVGAAGGRAAPVALLVLAPSTLPHAAVGCVDWLAVAPAHRRRGLGRRLVALAQSRAAALGWRQLHVSTFHTNRAALHLYIEAGFCPAATLRDYAGPGVHYVQLVWEPPGTPVAGTAASPGPGPRPDDA